MTTTKLPRKRPCASCPYRRDVPSGVWDATEYAKLPQYDGSIAEQALAGAVRMFGCHQADGHLCAGWAGYRDPDDLLALRIGILDHKIDEAVLDYTTDVPLWESGTQACEHGLAEVEAPTVAAEEVIVKLVTAKLRRLPHGTS